MGLNPPKPLPTDNDIVVGEILKAIVGQFGFKAKLDNRSNWVGGRAIIWATVLVRMTSNPHAGVTRTATIRPTVEAMERFLMFPKTDKIRTIGMFISSVHVAPRRSSEEPKLRLADAWRAALILDKDITLAE